MKPLNQVYISALLMFSVAVSQNNDDEGRPYEFGFTIDGQQHRHEKKDQNGIVQGEFGFITADGVYHVTVYATDENGNFKILSMRNIRISAPLDGSPATGPISPEAGKYLGKQKKPESPKTVNQQQQYSQAPQISQSVTQSTGSYVFTTQSTIKPACGGCGYVTLKPFQFQNPAFTESTITGLSSANTYDRNQQPSSGIQTGQVLTDISPAVTQQSEHSRDGISTPLNIETKQVINQEVPKLPVNNLHVNPDDRKYSQNTQHNSPGTELLPPGVNTQYQEEIYPTQEIQNQQRLVTDLHLLRLQQPENQQAVFQSPENYERKQKPLPISEVILPKEINNQNQGETYFSQQQGRNIPTNVAVGSNTLRQSQGQTSKLPPIHVSDNVIHVGGNKPLDIPIKDKYPGMVDGLPEGVNEENIKDILYKFHYTVGFHGHYEKGLKNGAKIGGYFVNGRDGISRVVTYVADENGYRPKFKFINLGLESSDTPKKGSEKQFGLKSFEFIWYPVE